MAAKTAYRVGDLLTLRPEDGVKAYELRDGELIPVGNAGGWHEIVKTKTLRKLDRFVEAHALGWILSESMFTLGEDRARIPDVAFVRMEKWNNLPQENAPIPFAPDLAIEIVSESENAAEAETKVGDYLAAGVTEVWQMYPRERRIRIRREGEIRDVEGDQMVITSVLPGFSLAASEFFKK